MRLLSDATLTMSLTTSDIFYCALSLFSETCFPHPNLYKVVGELLRFRQIQFLSNYPTVAEFIESRNALYAHDASRYPMYFDPSMKDRLLAENVQVTPKEADTTRSLVEAIDHRCRQGASSFSRLQCRETDAKALCQIIRSGLDALGDKAITFAAFQPFIPEKSLVITRCVRRTISEEYTSHYQSSLRGDIVTGISGLEYYDDLSHSFPCLDYPCSRAILESLWPNYDDLINNSQLVPDLLMLRGTDFHERFCEEVATYLRTLEVLSAVRCNASTRPECRFAITDDLKRFRPRTHGLSVRGNDPFAVASLDLHDHADKRSREDRQFKEIIEMVGNVRRSGGEKILLCTATDVEDDTLSEIAHEQKIRLSPRRGTNGTYISLGTIGWSDVTWVRSQAGIAGPAGAEVTTLDAINDVSPDYVISCGICFGRSPEKQSLGDVLISEWVRFYERQRRGSSTVPRGDRVPANPLLLQIARLVRVLRKNVTVHTGVLLSGEKLVDDPEFKKCLWEIEPEAIGGDMEGAGVMSACYRRSVPWIVIKGISDWGENKGDKDQKRAAENAIRFVLDMLRKGFGPLPPKPIE